MRARSIERGLAMALAGGVVVASIALADTDRAVTIDNFTFGPNELTVPLGTEVVWTNRDDIPHTVVSAADPALFRSRPLDTDDKFSVTFNTAGTHRYYCSIHPRMTGTVTVR